MSELPQRRFCPAPPMASILRLYLQPTSVGRPANIFPTFVFTALAVLAQHGAENTRFLKKVGCAANKALVLWVCRPTKFEIIPLSEFCWLVLAGLPDAQMDPVKPAACFNLVCVVLQLPSDAYLPICSAELLASDPRTSTETPDCGALL